MNNLENLASQILRKHLAHITALRKTKTLKILTLNFSYLSSDEYKIVKSEEKFIKKTKMYPQKQRCYLNVTLLQNLI